MFGPAADISVHLSLDLFLQKYPDLTRDHFVYTEKLSLLLARLAARLSSATLNLLLQGMSGESVFDASGCVVDGVADMWAKAMEMRPDLTETYFSFLEQVH